MKLKVSPLLIIMMAALVILGFYNELICYFVTIIVHEMAHAEMSRRLGYSLNVFRLTPYGASLTGEFEGVKRGDEILIAFAGPVANIIIATFLVALWWLAPDTYYLTEAFVISNVATALFNFIPIFPLDGGRALLAFLSAYVNREKAYKIMRIAGGVIAVCFCGLFIASLVLKMNFSFASVAVFMFAATVFPDKNSKYQRLYSMAFRSEKIKNGLTVKEIMVREDATFLQLARLINGNYFHRFIIVDSNFNKIAQLSEVELESLSARYGSEIHVAGALKSAATSTRGNTHNTHGK